MSQQKVSHFKYTLAILSSRYAVSGGEQKDESLIHFMFKIILFFSSFERFISDFTFQF